MVLILKWRREFKKKSVDHFENSMKVAGFLLWVIFRTVEVSKPIFWGMNKTCTFLKFGICVDDCREAPNGERERFLFREGVR